MPVTIPGAKPRAILTMLGLHVGSVVSADTLVELLWGEDPPRTAAKALQTHISSLRRALGDGVVLTEGGGWTLADSEVDASHYKSAARLGRDAAAAGDTGLAVARLEEALALWRGIPELPDGRRGTSEKTRWIEGHAALVEDRADALLATGRAAEIIGELEAAVADAPLRERRWGQLMLALYRAGRQGEALGAYQRARTLLADELGVDPGPELRRLETAIVAQDTALEMPGAQDVSAVTRAVTFLLTDIEGSTAAWEADAAAMAVALARHDELVEQVVTSRGGRLIKTRGEGDATFSVFERPSAAAAAALELQDAIVHEPWALREPMRVRVALHTGEAELRDGDYFGRAVNRAARLRSLAAGGQILCSGATAELVIDSLPDDVVLADLGTRQLKNLARPEHVFELRPETAEERDEEVPGEAPLERPSLPAVLAGPGPFVGRGRELERLFSAWQTALAGGTNAVLIAGEPGVGKTRLAGEWSRQAYDQGALVIYGRCDEDLGAPYQPFAEALRSLVPCLGSGRLRGLRGVEALLPLVPGLTDVLPDLAAPTRADPDTERYALFDAVVALLGVASASAPVVLILDDLHWAAKPTLLLLRHLLRFGERARVQIIGTYRGTDLDRSHPLSAMLADLHRDGTATRLQLGGLDEDDVTAYVAEAGYNDEELARALASVTGGNPFFLIEALRHVDESGGRWDQSTLPQGVREAVSRRLSRLAPETNKALAAAAVVGSRFALELVERVVGDDLVDPFDEACKAGIVIEEPGGHYRFNHALVRQSLLAELPSVRRMRLHQRIATTLENEPGADDELLAELAHHYFECAWAGNAVKAVEYCRRAADQAMARLAYEGAAELYDRALHALEEIDDELPDRDDQTAELLIARCEALLAAGDVTSAPGAVTQLQSATVDSARLAAWATCFDGQLSMLTQPERLDEIEIAVGAAAETLAGLDDAAGEAMAHTVRAGCLARLGRIGDCEIALDDALTAARRAREHRRVNAVLANAPLAALWGPNPVPRAGGRCLDVVRLLRITTDSPAVEATSTRCQAVLEAFRGRAAAARRMIDSARRTVTELGLRHARLEVEQFAGIVELVVDDPAAAEPHLRKAYKGFRRMGLDADTAETAALLGRACLTLGREAEADELCTESERLAGHALKPSIAWRTLRARLLSRAGDHDDARRVAEAAVGLADRTDALVDHADACLSLATVLGAAGDAAGARAAAERAVGLYERKGAAALVERAHGLLGAEHRTLPAPRETPRQVEPDTACVRAAERMSAAIERQAWDEIAQMYSPNAFIESRRKIVGFTQMTSGDWVPAQRSILGSGAVRVTQVVIAVRGERLALSRLRVGSADVSPGAPYDEFLSLYGIDEEGRFDLQVWFDVDDVDGAIAELDAAHARFGEEQPRAVRLENAATRVHERVPPVAEVPFEPPSAEIDNAAVRVGERVMAAVHRRAWDEFEQLFAPGVSIENRRKVVGLTLPSDEWRREWRREVETGAMRVKHVMVAARGERLALARMEAGTEDGGPGAPYEELLHLYAIDEDGRVALQMFFDVEDLDAAMAELDAAAARFEEERLRARRLENTAARVVERGYSYFAERDWDALAATVAENYSGIDHRRVVNAGTQHGRDSMINDLRAAAEVGFTISMVSAVAIRGERLVLARIRASGRDPEAVQDDALNVVEIDTDERITAVFVFDLEDFDGAVAELDARYLAGEAALHSRMWSAMSAAYAAINRREIPRITTDFVSKDHRRGATFAPGDMVEYLRAGWDLDHHIVYYIEAVHRLSDSGIVVTHEGHGSSPEGFGAEWREVMLFTLRGDSFDRCEVFAEADIDAALARFDQLSLPARRLENAASRVLERYFVRFAARDWDVMAETLTDDFVTNDRRRVVNAGVRRGRDAEIANMQSFADIGIVNIAPTTIATRGERLVLCRHDVSFRDWAEAYDVISVVEITDTQISAHVMFDADDIAAAIEELDTRYLAGEAAPHAQTWSVIAASYAALNRHELPATTPDCVNIDHRHEAAFGPGDVTAYIRAGWDRNQEITIYVEQVHRLDSVGAVINYAAHETSREGLDAEWRGTAVLTVEGDMINRTEVFDEMDVDAALTRFEQLSRPAPRLENAASQVAERFLDRFAARDWDALTDIFAADFSNADRRRVVGAGIGHGRDVEIASIRAGYDLGGKNMTSTVIATRGTRLILSRTRHSGAAEAAEGFLVDTLSVVEVNTDNRIAARIVFEPNDIDAAIAELDARYLAGEAAAHARTWSVITRTYAAFNRREFPPTTPDWVNIDHRRGASLGPGDTNAYLRATWDLAPDISIYIEAVERLNGIGGVITHAAHGTSQEGFHAEWRETTVLTVDGDLINRSEIFDEAGLDAAIAKFEQLSRPAQRLENAASQALEQWLAHFASRDWDAMAALVADDYYGDDRRPVFGAGIQRGGDVMIRQFQTAADLDVTRAASDAVATRGNRVVLTHTLFSRIDDGPDAFRVDVLYVVEINADGRISALIAFDSSQFEAAIQELDARYLAGEAAAHAHTWSVIVDGYAALNRHELTAMAADVVTIDHRRVAGFAPGEGIAYARAGLDLVQHTRTYVEAVHRLTNLGAVCTHIGQQTSQEGFDAEWRLAVIYGVGGDLINRFEAFDEADLDTAITRFEQLHPSTPRLENTATRVLERVYADIAARDWDAVGQTAAENVSVEDRRRVVNAGIRLGRDDAIENARATVDVGFTMTVVGALATRGDRVALTRVRVSGRDPGAVQNDALSIVEIDTDDRIVAIVVFDLDDTDAAFAELDDRYVAGEAAPHAHTWSVVAGVFAALKRHEIWPTTPDFMDVDRRRLAVETGGFEAYLHAIWDVTDYVSVHITAVHRLTALGAVVTHASHATSQEGLDAEWQNVNLLTVDGELISRAELFDEADLDAALARFDELEPKAQRRLGNAASQAYERFRTQFAARDWAAMAELLTVDFCGDDRRPVVGIGSQRGRDVLIRQFQTALDLEVTQAAADAIATRGDRLVLTRTRFSRIDEKPDAFRVDLLHVVEINADERISAIVAFDPNDFDAATQELDARYLAGEAAAHARTWSVLMQAYAALNRHEMPSTTPDWVNVDHRRGASFASGDMPALLDAAWNLTADLRHSIEAVHRLNDLGAVVTNASHET
jgi:class 3 adenylate cyclase